MGRYLLAGILCLWCVHDGNAQSLDSLSWVPNGGQQGTEFLATVSGHADRWPVFFWTSHPGIEWLAMDTKGTVRVRIAPDVPLGTHYVRGFHEGAASPLRAFVVDELPEVVEVEPNDDVRAVSVPSSESFVFQGVLQKSGDVDHFAVQGVKGDRWRFRVDANRELRSPMDGCLELLDAGGNVVASNLDRFGLDPALEWTCPKDGRYVLRIFAFPAVPDSTIGYGGGEGFRYRVRCVRGTDTSWEWGIRRQAVLLREPNDVAAPIAWESLGVDDTRVRTSRYASPLVFWGAMEDRQDVDAILVTIPEPGHWTIRAIARELGTEMEPVIEVWDTSGKRLSADGESGEIRGPMLVDQFSQPGQYVVAIRDLNQGHGASVGYRLEMFDDVPRVIGKIARDVYVGQVGTSIPIEVNLERVRGFKDEVTVRCVGGDGFLASEAVVSKLGEDSANKVTLHVTVSKPCSIPLRIRVDSNGNESQGWGTNEMGSPDLWIIATEPKP